MIFYRTADLLIALFITIGALVITYEVYKIHNKTEGRRCLLFLSTGMFVRGIILIYYALLARAQEYYSAIDLLSMTWIAVALIYTVYKITR